MIDRSLDFLFCLHNQGAGSDGGEAKQSCPRFTMLQTYMDGVEPKKTYVYTLLYQFDILAIVNQLIEFHWFQPARELPDAVVCFAESSQTDPLVWLGSQEVMQFTGQVRAQTNKTPIFKLVASSQNPCSRLCPWQQGSSVNLNLKSRSNINFLLYPSTHRIPFNQCARDSAIRSDETIHIEEAFN